MFTLRESMLFCEKWSRSFELESVFVPIFRKTDAWFAGRTRFAQVMRGSLTARFED
jgi:hypothetical protein